MHPSHEKESNVVATQNTSSFFQKLVIAFEEGAKV